MAISNQRWLQIYAKAIELQILISKQQEQMLENQSKMLGLLEKIEGHFSNGFRSELKAFIQEQVQGLRVDMEKCAGKDKEDNKKQADLVQTLVTAVDEVKSSIWRQGWLWGGIALFTVVNAIATIISLWANGVVIPSN